MHEEMAILNNNKFNLNKIGVSALNYLSSESAQCKNDPVKFTVK